MEEKPFSLMNHEGLSCGLLGGCFVVSGGLKEVVGKFLFRDADKLGDKFDAGLFVLTFQHHAWHFRGFWRAGCRHFLHGFEGLFELLIVRIFLGDPHFDDHAGVFAGVDFAFVSVDGFHFASGGYLGLRNFCGGSAWSGRGCGDSLHVHGHGHFLIMHQRGHITGFCVDDARGGRVIIRAKFGTLNGHGNGVGSFRLAGEHVLSHDQPRFRLVWALGEKPGR